MTDIPVGALYVSMFNDSDHVRVTEVTPDNDPRRSRIKVEHRYGGDVRYFTAATFELEYRKQ